jgi:uncharacterized protein
MKKEGVFLRAEWKNLVMINYKVDPELLQPLVPPHTTLDFFHGSTYVSLIGFMFYNTRVLGIKIPWHVNFEEVNLRFYVKHQYGSEMRHGVVFINEIVKLPMLALAANMLYHEKYQTRKMRHVTEDPHHLMYEWKTSGCWNFIGASITGEKIPLLPGSKEVFISERFWGFSKAGRAKTFMYRVEHPRWNLCELRDYKCGCDFGQNFGNRFSILDAASVDSVYVLDGSEVEIYQKRKIV